MPSTQPVRHMVTFKFKSGTSEGVIEDIVVSSLLLIAWLYHFLTYGDLQTRLHNLPSKISEIRALDTGRDLGLDSQRNEDVGLCVDFDSTADFQSFTTNEHYTSVVRDNILPVMKARNAIEVTF